MRKRLASPFILAPSRENTPAPKCSEGGQGGWPAYRCRKTLHRRPSPDPRPSQPCAGCASVRGVDVGAGEIAAFLGASDGKNNFSRVHAEDIQNDEESCAWAWRIFMWFWKRTVFGRSGPAGTSCPSKGFLLPICGYLLAFRFLVAPFVKALRLAPIPAPGRPLRNLYAACLAVEENDPRIFTALLGTALCGRHDTGFFCLLVSLMESDPLLPHLKKYLHFPTQTDIYAFSWRHPEALDAIDRKFPTWNRPVFKRRPLVCKCALSVLLISMVAGSSSSSSVWLCRLSPRALM